MQITSLHLHCRTITPLQMNGATSQPQVRAASFRGILRYWLRAALGNQAGSDVVALKKAETRYFGSQETSSPLRVQVASRGKPITRRISYKAEAPLFYAGRNTEFAFYPINKSIRITLDTHPLRPISQVFNDGLYAGLALAFQLGAFGKRARRGSGALVVESVDTEGLNLPDSLVTHLTHVSANASDRVAFLQTLLGDVFKLSSTHTAPFGKIADYPAVTSNHLKLWVGQRGFSDYQDAMNQMWKITGAYHGRGKWAWGYARGGRRASALHMRVWQDADQLYYPQVAILYAGTQSERWSEIDDVATEFNTAPNFIRVHP